MIFFLKYGEAEHKVRVESRNQQTFVQFDDEPERSVDLQYFGNDCTYLEDKKVFFANIAVSKNEATVWRPQGMVTLGVESEYRRIVSKLRGQDVASENNVLAKMPGKIVKIVAKVGDEIKKGTSLLVMEAMKMENEIRATAPAKITNICVKEGQAVETGALLMELELGEAEE